MGKKINPFTYLHSDIQFDELLPYLSSSLFVSPSLLKVVRVCVCVCVCVCEYFSFVFAPLIKAFFLSNKQAFETYIYIYIYIYIYASRKMMTTEFMPEHTPNSLRVQTVIYTKQNYSKGFESFNFLHFALYRICKVNKYIRVYRFWLLLCAKHLKGVRGNRSNL